MFERIPREIALNWTIFHLKRNICGSGTFSAFFDNIARFFWLPNVARLTSTAAIRANSWESIQFNLRYRTRHSPRGQFSNMHVAKTRNIQVFPHIQLFFSLIDIWSKCKREHWLSIMKMLISQRQRLYFMEMCKKTILVDLIKKCRWFDNSIKLHFSMIRTHVQLFNVIFWYDKDSKYLYCLHYIEIGMTWFYLQTTQRKNITSHFFPSSEYYE